MELDTHQPYDYCTASFVVSDTLTMMQAAQTTKANPYGGGGLSPATASHSVYFKSEFGQVSLRAAFEMLAPTLNAIDLFAL